MKKISYYLIFIIAVGLVLVSFWIYQKYFQKGETELLKFKVERGSIEEIVGARGEVVPQKDFDLTFPFPGRIERVFVREGQEVGPGQALIKLETKELEWELEILKAKLSQSQTNLEKLLAGPGEEYIKFLETKVANAEVAVSDAELNLKNVKDKAEVDLANLYGDVLDILNDAYTKADDAVRNKTAEMFNNDDPDNPDLTFMTTDSAIEWEVERKRFRAETELASFKSELDILSSSDYSQLEKALVKAKNHLEIVRDFLQKMNDAVSDAVGVVAATLKTYRSDLYTARTNVNIAISNINNKEQEISSQKSANQKNITLAETTLHEAKSALSLAQAELNLEKAGPRQEDIEIAKSQVKELQSQIEITKEKLRKSTLYSPDSTRVAKIFFEEGEFLNQGEIAVSLFALGFKIQSDISELEIGKIKEIDGNEVLIRLDAFPGLEFKGQVVSVEPKEIIKEGDKYYRVNIYFEAEQAKIRPGMSADLKIKISLKENVLKIPELVVYEREDRKFVKVLEGDRVEEIEIKTGISDGQYIEIIEGLNEGQIVVIATD